MPTSILVCIKTVPDLAAGEELTIAGRWIDETAISWCMNHYDTHALETALTIKDNHADVTIEVISAGPDRVRDTIRRAMAMGADTGIHLAMDTARQLPPHTTALAIARYAERKSYDLILAGAMSEDDMHGTTGPMIAAALDLPCAVAAVELATDITAGKITATCEMEGGMAEIVQLSGPALVTVQTGRQIPRYPSLSNTLRSRRQPIERVVQVETDYHAPRIESLGVAYPERVSTCQLIEGTVIEKADTLLQFFNDKGWLK